jgi:RNA polymerase sigma-70 factor (ECF subfamily)
MSIILDIQIPAHVLMRARDGDTAAHEVIYMRFAKPVYTLLRRLVMRPAVAEDLLQDVFVEILKSMDAYNGSGSFAGWVRSIAVTKALMYLRSPWHRRLSWFGEDVVASLEASNATHTDSMLSDLERALGKLSAQRRSVVWLHDIEGYTHAEIAQLFGHTPSFSKSQLARAHEELRGLLEPQSGGLTCTPVTRN